MESNLKAIELKDLWRRYKDDQDEQARERLVLSYAPLVKYVAGRMSSGLPSHVEEADLISYGLLGLISAIKRFEPEREIKFETLFPARLQLRQGSLDDEAEAEEARIGHGVRGRRLGLGDLARLEAARADVDALRRAGSRRCGPSGRSRRTDAWSRPSSASDSGRRPGACRRSDRFEPSGPRV